MSARTGTRRLRGWDARRVVYKAASALVQYPDERVLARTGEVLQAVAILPPSRERRALERFLVYWRSTPSPALARAYVETFDFSRRSGPYLTYFEHGDTRHRGAALVRLRALYREAGLALREDSGELPDHLPIVLEFAALAPEEQGRAALGEVRLGLESLRRGLREAGSPYAHLLEAVCSGLSRLGARQVGALRRLEEEGPPAERVGLEPYGAVSGTSGQDAAT